MDMDHTGCHQFVFWLSHSPVPDWLLCKKCQPRLRHVLSLDAPEHELPRVRVRQVVGAVEHVV
jgi:hypothetical protein